MKTYMLLLVVAVLTAVAGCELPGRAPKRSQARADDLKKMGRAWHNYHDAHSRGPKSWHELIAFGQNDPKSDVEAIERLRSDGVKVNWVESFSKMTAGSSNTLLAWEPSVEQSEGWVLTGDTSVSWKSREEFEKLDRGGVVEGAGIERADPASP